MQRGWEVTLSDDTILNEEICSWREVKKNKIKKLSLIFDGRRWDLTNKDSYFIRNSASAIPGCSESFRVEHRCIGYYEGSKKIFYSINEHTGEFSMFVE
jgi:hypothetical protein